MSMFSPNMNIRPYIGDESGNQLVPEPSRLIGSARLMEECIDMECSMFEVRCLMCVGRWALGVERWTPARDLSELDACSRFIGVGGLPSLTGTSFIPHFGQFPG